MFREEIVFHKPWFKRHQKALLILANTFFGKRILCINGDRSAVGTNKIVKIEPHAITWKNQDGTFSTEFRTHAKFARRLYYAFKPLWQLMHIWDSLTSPLPYLNLGFDTLTVYPNADPEVNTMDGWVDMVSTDAVRTWAQIRAASGNMNNTTSAQVDMVRAGCNYGSPYWLYLSRGFFLFDTSSLGASASIVSSTLSFYGSFKSNNFSNAWLDFNVYSSNPASNTNLVNSDFRNVGSIPFSSNKTYNDWSTSGYNDFILNTAGKAAVSKTGITKFSTRSATHDAGGATPTWEEGKMILCYAYSADQTGTANDPKLVVTYGTPATVSNSVSFVLGNTIPLTITNPRNHYLVSELFVNNVLIKSEQVGQVMSHIIEPSAGEVEDMYEQIPSATSCAMFVRIKSYLDSGYSTQVGSNQDKSGTMSIDQTINKPTFTTFSLTNVDKNVVVKDKYGNTLITSSTSTLLGSNDKMIKGYSKVRASIEVANKMVALNGATPVSYQMSNGQQSNSGAYSADTVVNIDIDNATDISTTISAYDSRGLFTTVEEELSSITDYSPVNLYGLILSRDDNVDTPTKLQFNGLVWDGYFGGGTSGVQNDLVCEYRYKETTESWGAQTWNEITPTVTSGVISFDDYIEGDLGATGFDDAKSFNIEVRAYDRLSQVIIEGIINKGVPLVDFYNSGGISGIAIKEKYDPDNSATAQVEGLIDSENIQTGWSKIDGTISSVGTNVIEVPDDQRKKLEIGTRVQVTKTLDPWGYWKFDDPNNLGQDSSGHSYNFDEYGAPGSVPGRFGMALELDGESRLSGPIIGYNFTEPFGVGAWIKTSTSGVSQPIFSLYFMTPEARYGITLEITNLGYGSIISYRGTGWTQATDWQRATGNVDITDGEWHYVVGVWTGSALQIYIDGIMQTKTLWPYGVNQPILDFELHVGYEDGAYYTGLIDDLFFLVDRRLANSEIYNQYSMNIPLDLKAASNYVITNKGNNTVTVSPVNSLNLTGDIDSIKYSHKYVPLGFPTNKQYCIVGYKAQNVPNNIYTALNFVDIGFNPNNLWVPTLPSRITIQVPGLYWIGGTCTYPSAGFPANHQLLVARNGNYSSPYMGTTYNAVSVSGIIHLSEGDYVELITHQATGATRATGNYTMFYVCQVL